MRSLHRILSALIVCCVFAIGPASAAPLLDDQFDDGNPATNTLGPGNGFNPSFGSGLVTEDVDGLLKLTNLNSANLTGLLSQDTFTANGAQTLYGSFTFTKMIRPDMANNDAGTSRWYAGFFDNNEDTDGDGFETFGSPPLANVSGGNNKGGLWLAFKEREDEVGRELNGDEGSLYYVLADQSVHLLATWTWNRSVFAFNEDNVSSGLRSDRIPQELIIPNIRAEVSANSTGYGVRFYSDSDAAVLPDDISGTWAAAGVTDLSSLATVRAVGFAGQNGQSTEVFVDRVYVDNEPQRDADNSGQLFTWGPRVADGSWSNTSGWQEGGVDTSSIPLVVTATRQADPVQILSGTVRVNTGDQGAWSLQIDNGAEVEVASTRTLEIIDNVSPSATNIQAGGNLTLGGTLITPSMGGAGALTFADGTLRIDHGSIGALATSSDGTISNAREVSVGMATLGAGNTLNKQRRGLLILDQSGGNNSLAAGSAIDVQSGDVAGVNNAASNAFGSANVHLNGGNLTLSASAASSVAFDSPIAVNQSAIIQAAQVTGALANQTVTLGGTNGVNIASGKEAILRTADGYTMNVAGGVSGAGTLSVGDGAKVNLNGSITPAVVGFRGDLSNVTVGPGVVPTSAFKFVPIESTPDMAVNFALGGSAGVNIEGEVDGSVTLANGSNNYSGTTRIMRGALRPTAGGGALPGNYNGDSTVDENDYDVWAASFGNAVTPGSGADGNGNGIVDAADYVVWRDHEGASAGGSGLPAGSLLQFEGGGVEDVAVLEISQNFARNIGAGAGEVNWVGAGGFSATGGTADVTLEGGATLAWDSATAGFNGQNLKLGSDTADGRVRLTNNIDLNNAPRTIEVTDNPATDADVAEISGAISSSAGGADVLIVRGSSNDFRSGLLVLSGANSFTTLEIGEGTVQAADGVGLPASANLLLRSAVTNDIPAVLAGSGTFARNIGGAAGEVQWANDGGVGGGFAAVGGDLTVTLEGGATLQWGDANLGFNGAELQLGSTVATGVTTFTNNVDGGGANRTFETFDNPLTDADRVVLSGNYTNFGNFRVDGDGGVETTGNVVMNNNLVLVNNAGPGQLRMLINGTMTVHNNISLDVSGADCFVNGTVSVDNDIQGRSGNSFGGSGTVFLVDTDNDGQGTQRAQIMNGGFLRPGPDFDAVGTLTVNLTAAAGDATKANFQIENGGAYEMEFKNDGGIQHDSVSLLSTSGFQNLQLGLAAGDTWTLELDALNDLSGLIGGTDEFNLLTWNENIDFFTNGAVHGQNTSGVVDNVILSSADFNVSGASVRYDVANDFSGRVYVTGLALSGSGAVAGSQVPEPASCLLIVFAGTVLINCRRRFGC